MKVIFTLRLRQGDPRDAGKIARHICEKYADVIWCFAIGNEPNVFSPEYTKFFEGWQGFAKIINSPEFAPTARFAGPSSTAGKTAWTRDFARQLAGTGKLLVATQHLYPGGNADLVKDPAVGRELLLSPKWIEEYQKFHDSFVPDVLATGIPYRLGETNSFWNGGREGASNTFAAALWALDYLNWWAAHGANGLNFHTGDFVAKSETNTRCMYSAIWSTPNGYEAKPVAYALAVFNLTRHGRPLPTNLASNDQNLNLTAYTISNSHDVYLTLINKEHGAESRTAKVKVIFPTEAQVRIMRLESIHGDIASTTGITAGGEAIKDDGRWDGRWSDLPTPQKVRPLEIEVPAASAAVVRFSRP